MLLALVLLALTATTAWTVVPSASPMSISCPRRPLLHAMSDTDDLALVDPAFAGDELARTWARAGKGKPVWKPGDDTGDSALDARLLYSNWVLNPMKLYVREGCVQSTAAALLFGWLKLPFRSVAHDGDGASPRLEGAGVPGEDGLATFGELVSFGFAFSKESGCAPATERADVAAWLEAPSVATFAPLLRGVQPGDGAPCLNAWGLSVDDALVLPVLKQQMDADASADQTGKIDAFVRLNYERAGL